MRLIILMTLLGVTGCAVPQSDAAFCGPDFTDAVKRLGSEALAYPDTPEPLGIAVADVVTGHKAGCAK